MRSLLDKYLVIYIKVWAEVMIAGNKRPRDQWPGGKLELVKRIKIMWTLYMVGDINVRRDLRSVTETWNGAVMRPTPACIL